MAAAAFFFRGLPDADLPGDPDDAALLPEALLFVLAAVPALVGRPAASLDVAAGRELALFGIAVADVRAVFVAAPPVLARAGLAPPVLARAGLAPPVLVRAGLAPPVLVRAGLATPEAGRELGEAPDVGSLLRTVVDVVVFLAAGEAVLLLPLLPAEAPADAEDEAGAFFVVARAAVAEGLLFEETGGKKTGGVSEKGR